jgi:hypothetical protein
MCLSLEVDGKDMPVNTPISTTTKEKLETLMALLASTLDLDPERKRELSERLVQVAGERLARFEQASSTFSELDPRVSTLAIDELATNLLDWLVMRVVLSLSESRVNGAERRGRRTRSVDGIAGA